MATYEITDNEKGRTYRFQLDQEPDDDFFDSDDFKNFIAEEDKRMDNTDYSKKNYNEGLVVPKNNQGKSASGIVSYDEAKKKVGKGQSALRGGVQGLTLGYGDEIGAGLVAPFSDKSYAEIRDKVREQNSLSQEANPYTYGGAKIAGEIPLFIEAGAAAGVKNAATLGGKVLRSGASAAPIGGAISIGEDEGKPDLTKAALMSLATGAGGVGGELTGAGLGALATKYAPNVIGASKAIIKDLSPARRKELGEYVLKNAGEDGIVERVLTPFKSTDDLIKSNDKNLQAAGKTIGDTIDAVDNSGYNSLKVDAQKMAQNISTKLSPNVPNAPINREIVGAINDSVDNLLEYGAKFDPVAGKIPVKAIQELKQKYGEITSFTPTTASEGFANQANQKIYGELQEAIKMKIREFTLLDTMRLLGANPNFVNLTRAQIDDIVAANTKKVLGAFGDANKVYKNGSDALRAITNLKNIEEGNNLLGFSAKIAGGVAAGSGDPLAALATSAAIEAGNRYIPRAAVSIASDIGKSNTKIFPELGSLLNREDPQEARQNDAAKAAFDQQFGGRR